MEKKPVNMVKFDITAGKLLNLLSSFERVENSDTEYALRGDIYETAKDLVFAFEYSVRLMNGENKAGEWICYACNKEDIRDECDEEQDENSEE